MNRWVVRLVGVMMLLLFIMVFTQLYKQLVQLQQQGGRSKPAATSTP